MKKLIEAILGVLGIGPFASAEVFEASMNFDLENVGRFLQRLNSKLEIGLEVEELVSFTQNTAVDNERLLTLKIYYNGAQIDLDYRVFMDDIDTPDLYFYTVSESLAVSISKQMSEFAEELGI